MKKLAAISFIVLLLFNLVGYKIVFYYAQNQSDRQVQATLDNNLYNEADLIAIKVKLSLPYQSSSAQFERFDGEIRAKGKIYKYVKRRFFNGELTLLCLPDVNKMRLETAKDDFFKNMNGLIKNTGSQNPGKSKANLSKIFSGEYLQCYPKYPSPVYTFGSSISHTNCCINLPALPHATIEKPPQAV